MKSLQEKLVPLSKLVFLLGLVCTKLGATTIEDVYRIELKEWYKFDKTYRASKEYRPGVSHEIDSCLKQKQFNDCEMEWCILRARIYYSKHWIELAEKKRLTCPERDIQINFNDRLKSVKKSYQNCKRIPSHLRSSKNSLCR